MYNTNSYKRKKRRFGKKAMLFGGLLLVALAAGGYFLFARSDNNTVTEADTPDPEKINLDPPTEEQKKATEEYKESLANDNPPTPPTNSTGKKQVTPIITSVENDTIRAYVPGIIEEGGTCTVEATHTANHSQVVTGASTGFADASYTGCPPVTLNLGSGSWSIQVRYSSSTAEGKSTSYLY